MQDVNWKGQLDKKGVLLHAVGTIELKHIIFSRLKNDAEKSISERMLHFSNELDDFYYAGVLSETWDRQKKRYMPKPGIRNEPLDTLVYAFAAAYHPRIRADRKTDKDWDRVAYTINDPHNQKNLTPNATELQKEPTKAKEWREQSRFFAFRERFSGRFRERR